jgi:hypothetical protein
LNKKQWKSNILKNHLNLLVKKILFITLNIALYDYLKNELSLGIFIIVNTIGVIFFIILSYEGAVVEPKSHDGKLARHFGAKKRPHTPATRIKKFYQLVGAMGVIVNISMIAAQFLEQAI